MYERCICAQAGGRKMAGSLRDQQPCCKMCAGRGLINFPKAFLLRFLASKNEEKEKNRIILKDCGCHWLVFQVAMSTFLFVKKHLKYALGHPIFKLIGLY